ncbi:MAG: sensor histidine kinase [Spirochaetia bacterium]
MGKYIGIIFFICILCFPVFPGDLEPGSIHVLILHSYHQGYSWTDNVQQGIDSVFTAHNAEYELDVEYMDLIRHDVAAIFPAFAHLLYVKFDEYKPDLVITCDDDALDFVFEYRELLFPGVPVVFGGLNAEDFDPVLLQDRADYTGVVERLDFASTIDLIHTLHWDVDNIAFVHDMTTSGLSDRSTISSLQSQYPDTEFLFPDSGEGVREAELMQWLSGFADNTVVYFLSFFRDAEGEHHTVEYITQRISQASPVPVYSHAQAFLGHGIFGGKMLSGEVHGESLGRRALAVLNGEVDADAPPLVESSNRYIFDYEQMQRFGISVRELPDESVIINRPLPFYQKYGLFIITFAISALVFSTILFIVLFILRKRSVKTLQQSEARLQLLLSQKEDIMREINHRVKNNLALVGSLINLKSRALHDSVDLTDLSQRIDTIRLVHEKLYKSDDISTVSLRSYIQEILDSVFSASVDKEVKVSNKIPEIDVNSKAAVTLGLITNEIATNAVKYGFDPENEYPEFTVAMKLDKEDDEYVYCLSNTGNRFPDDVDIEMPKSMGLRLVSALASQLEGKVEVKSESETTFILRFPKRVI